ncbi:MAG: glycosyl hydrolase [Chlorobi bacterium]|nr:glycosyl hydrolase [Chlorobiota bacterium]
MKIRKYRLLLLSALLFVSLGGYAGPKKSKDKTQTVTADTLINSHLVSGLKWRSIGPAFASGRIADFAVNPDNPSEFYVAVASGNIWKTTNNGQTFKPVFDKYGAYSVGCLAMDPDNSNVVWAGTGENNHQRALGYGDGVYKTVDGGKSWKNMGLKDSRQIGMILIDPRNTDVVYVAAEGSAWGPGGDRGLFKTTDGGKTWEKILEISENTGVNNIICDPRNPDILYATSEQRRRHVYTKIGGGPESAVYKSEDAGKTWRKIMKGLPSVNIGGMGIAISPQNPDVLYLIMEAAEGKSGFYRSSDRGESWTRMSDHHASGQYYNEIYCDPVQFDKVYSVETFSHVTTDGGKTWMKLNNKNRHVDDHALWIDPNDNQHYMIGGDGGIYITYDDGRNWRFVSNLPVTQFYRVAVDNAKPFYNVYGGTQDNNTLGGPSRNTKDVGVVSDEWIVTVGGDGFWVCVDPENPNIVYSEWQYGNVVRYDKKSGQRISIKPQPRKGEKTYRWNWNAPLIISPHSHTRLYMAANKLFRSDDRGDTWAVVSGDLTTGIDRNTWPVMGKYWGPDAVAKDVSTSLFGTIVSLDESPVKEGLIYVGTDDGLIQVTEDGGKTWRKVSSFPGVPEYTYVSDVFASRFDENVVYATFSNLKRDDFKPYILKSTDKGKSWKTIASDLPGNGSVHTVSQDFKNRDLLFAGTEFGVFFSVNGGENWVQLKAGIPTIPVHDIKIQQRENDLVIATFGRGFYILDDYSPLREISESMVENDAHLFNVKDALQYIPKSNKRSQGSTYYIARNPEYGAVFTLYLKDVPKTAMQIRREKDKKLFKEGKPVPQPSWKALEDEKKEIPPYLLITVKDEEGDVVRTMTAKPSKGIKRIYWDLRYDNPQIADVTKFDPYKKTKGGVLVMPGRYSVEMSLIHNGKSEKLDEPKEFNVILLNNSSLPASDRKEAVEFQLRVSRLSKAMYGTLRFVNDLKKEVTLMQQTALTLPGAHEKLLPEITRVKKELEDVLFRFNGVKAKASREEIPPADMPLMQRLYDVVYNQINNTSAITSTSRMEYSILEEEFPAVLDKVKNIADVEVKRLRKMMDEMNAPYTPCRIPEWK